MPGPTRYKVSIPENAPAGYNVTTVSATDPDGLDVLLTYRIVGANDNFVIDEQLVQNHLSNLFYFIHLFFTNRKAYFKLNCLTFKMSQNGIGVGINGCTT